MTTTNNNTSNNIKQVNCPGCQKIVHWNEANPYRPFCSKKCQLLDFGEWANENHVISEEMTQDTEEGKLTFNFSDFNEDEPFQS